jgi:hypothetical protein
MCDRSLNLRPPGSDTMLEDRSYQSDYKIQVI